MLGIKIKCPSGTICLHVDWWFSSTIQIQVSYWSSTNRHHLIECSLPPIKIAHLALNNNHSLTLHSGYTACLTYLLELVQMIEKKKNLVICFNVLGTELVGPSYRLFAGFLVQSFYSIGYMTLAGLAYALRDWRYIELAITLPVILFVPYIW